VYPSIALLSAVVFAGVEKKGWNNIFSMLVVVSIGIGFLNFLGTSWGIGPMQFSTSGSVQKMILPNSILVPLPFSHKRRVWLAPISWPPEKNEGKVDVILSRIINDWGNNKQAPRVLFTFEMSQITNALVSKISYEQLGRLYMYNLDGVVKGDGEEIIQRIGSADYVLVKNGTIDKRFKEGQSSSWDTFIWVVRLFNKVYKMDNKILPRAFIPIASISIPFDNSILVIYRRTRTISPEEWNQLKWEFHNEDSYLFVE
jgi:hypothetical protein